MRAWNRRVEAWMLGLRAWQFILACDVAALLAALVVSILAGLIWGFNFSATLGEVSGAILAASVMALALRDRMRIRAEQDYRG